MSLPTLPSELADDWRELTERVAALIGTRRAPACTTGTDAARARWTSDAQAEQMEAARACGACVLQVECFAYGITHKKERGVYGGTTEWQRDPRTRPATRRKESA